MQSRPTNSEVEVLQTFALRYPDLYAAHQAALTIDAESARLTDTPIAPSGTSVPVYDGPPAPSYLQESPDSPAPGPDNRRAVVAQPRSRSRSPIGRFASIEPAYVVVESVSDSETDMEVDQPRASRTDSDDSDNDGYTVVDRKRKRAPKAANSGPSAPPAKAAAKATTAGNRPSPAPRPASPPSATAPATAPSQDANARREKPPPPLFIQDKGKWDMLSRLLTDRKIFYTNARSTQQGIKVQVSSVNDHRALTKLLRKESISFHTYALEEEKKLRVVIRNVPKEVHTDAVCTDLKNQDFPVHAVHRMYSGKDRSPYDLVLVVLDRSPEGKAIFNLKTVCGLSGLDVQAPFRNGAPSQCHNCQLYGHAARFCYARPRCVKCLGDHATENCSRTRDSPDPPSCVLCGTQGHTANYRGCPRAPRTNRRVATERRPPPPPRPTYDRYQRVSPKLTVAPASQVTPAPLPTRNAWSKPPSMVKTIAPTRAPARAPVPARTTAPARAPAPVRAAPPAPPALIPHAAPRVARPVAPPPMPLMDTSLQEDIALVSDLAMSINIEEVRALARKMHSAQSPAEVIQYTLEHASLLSALKRFAPQTPPQYTHYG